jgi:uncharacterized protein (TIGR02646 family)
MKHIIKGQEPSEYSLWRTTPIEGQPPTYRDLKSDGTNKLKSEANRALIDALMKEQGYICCYCECRLIKDDSHIDHFKPQCDNTVNSLDYSNMLRSCQNQPKKGECELLHCGHLKGEWFHEQLLISPLSPSCEDRFSYTIDGAIYPRNESDDAAIKTIEKLGLNKGILKASRSEVIEPFLNLNNEMEEHELSLFVTGYLKMDSDGHFGQFWTTINYLSGEGNNTIEICPIQVVSTKDTKI